MTSINPDDTELSQATHRSNMADHLKEYIEKELQQLLHPLFKGKAVPIPERIDMILLLVFTYIDLLGYLYKGESSSVNAVGFIREYFGRFDQRYREVGGLLYHICRHGFVHKATPKRIKLQSGIVVDIQYVFNGQRQDHLKVAEPRPELQSATGEEIGVAKLYLDLPVIYDDLMIAIDAYAKDIQNNQSLADTFWEAFSTRRRAEDENDLLCRPYIEDSDFAYLMQFLSG